MKSFCIAVFVLLSLVTFAPAQQISPVTSSTHLVPVIQQQTMWCWAASMESLFKSYGYDVPQQMIVLAAFGKIVNETASTTTMTGLLNRSWTDAHGRRFNVSARVTDDHDNTAHQITNKEIVDALQNGGLVFFANATHAMVTDQLYLDNWGNIWSARVMDPEFGVRMAGLREIHALYAAVPVITPEK